VQTAQHHPEPTSLPRGSVAGLPGRVPFSRGGAAVQSPRRTSDSAWMKS
jgi:hypothetical protein